MSGLRVLVVEDEEVVARRLRRLSESILGERLERLLLAPTLADGFELLHESPIDLLFLDLNLYGEDGFELLRTAVAGSFHTIVVSAHVERAVEAFEHGVLDFVAKPFSKERLAKALNRFLDSGRSAPSARSLAIRKADRIELVPVASVVYLKGSGNYVEVVTEEGDTHLHDKTLDRLEQLLPDRFLRVHRSFLVDLSRIRGHRSYAGGRHEALLSEPFLDEPSREEQVIPVSRGRIAELKKRLGTL